MALSQPTAPLTGAAQAVPTATTPPPAGREPRSYLPFLGVANLGVYMALLTPVMVSMAFKIDHLVGADAAPAQLGMVMGVGALFALICNPLAGRLSDRTTSRLGMRRPWIIGGAIVGAAALAVVGTAQSVALVLVGLVHRAGRVQRRARRRQRDHPGPGAGRAPRQGVRPGRHGDAARPSCWAASSSTRSPPTSRGSSCPPPSA